MLAVTIVIALILLQQVLQPSVSMYLGRIINIAGFSAKIIASNI